MKQSSGLKSTAGSSRTRSPRKKRSATSLAQQISAQDFSISSLAQLKHDDLVTVLSSLPTSVAEELTRSWSFLARPDQLPPDDPRSAVTPKKPNDVDWSYWLLLAGRGAGKTRTGAETSREKVKQGIERLGLIAPTAADARDVMVEGESGILAHSHKDDVDYKGNLIGRPDYEPSKRRLTWKNGAVATLYSAEEPDRLRGPQHGFLWADELAAWQYPDDAWDMAMFGLRLGKNPQALISTTPRPIPIIRELMRSPLTRISRASTFANQSNLAKSFITKIVSKYEGTRLGRQELMGEVIEEAEGALWSRSMVEQALLEVPQPELLRIVVSIDPAMSANPTSNLTGIVVAGKGRDGRAYVLDDGSGRYTPDGWARKAVEFYDEHGADRIVAEGNQGGDLVRANLNTIRKNLPISIVWASRSKQARAEPVAALYEQGKVTHVHSFPELEDQQCTWEPLSGDPSPDRLDALVWALTELMITYDEEITFTPPIVISQPRSIPGA